jgi:RES domain-containing protein
VARPQGIPPRNLFWRISNYADLSGEGGRLSSARWHTEGVSVVYLSDSPASAMLERIVHLQEGSGKLPQFYDLLRIVASDPVEVQELFPLVHVAWRDDVELTRRLGDAWLASLETPMARVPSAILPHTWNYLLNPLHPDAAQVQIAEVIRERFDFRLFRFGAR